MNLEQFLSHLENFKGLEIQQLWSLTELDDNPKCYNRSHLEDIVVALEYSHDCDRLDFSEEIAFAKVMLHDNR